MIGNRVAIILNAQWCKISFAGVIPDIRSRCGNGRKQNNLFVGWVPVIGPDVGRPTNKIIK